MFYQSKYSFFALAVLLIASGVWSFFKFTELQTVRLELTATKTLLEDQTAIATELKTQILVLRSALVDSNTAREKDAETAADLRLKLAMFDEKLNTCEIERQVAAAGTATVKEYLSESQSALESLRNKYLEQTVAVENLNSKLLNAELTLKDLDFSLENANSELEKRTSELDAASFEIADLREQLQSSASSIEKEKLVAAQEAEKVKGLEKRLEYYLADIAAFKAAYSRKPANVCLGPADLSVDAAKAEAEAALAAMTAERDAALAEAAAVDQAGVDAAIAEAKAEAAEKVKKAGAAVQRALARTSDARAALVRADAACKIQIESLGNHFQTVLAKGAFERNKLAELLRQCEAEKIEE